MNKYLHEFLFSVLWRYILTLELLDYVVILYRVFWGSAKLFFIVVIPAKIPTSSGFQCLHLLTDTCQFPWWWGWWWWSWRPFKWVWNSIVLRLWSPLPWLLMMVSIFPCSYWQFAYLLWKIFTQVLFLLLNEIVSLLWVHFSDWSLFSAQVVMYVSKKGREVKFHIPHCQGSSKTDKFILNYAAALRCSAALNCNSVTVTSSGDWVTWHSLDAPL